MSRDADTEIVSREELTKLLADATGTSAEALDRAARDIEIDSPGEADVIKE